MKITAKTAALILPLFFLVGILSTMAAGYWATESSKTPVKYETGEFAGEYNPADIRGSYSFGDIENVFGIPVDSLARAFGFTGEEDPSAIQAKLFEEVYGIVDGKEVGTDSLRYFVALYLGLPYEPDEETALPQPALSVLKKEAALSEETLAEVESRLVSLETVRLETDAVAETEHEEALDTTIKGKTTFADLYTWGLTEDQVRQGLGGLEPGARGTAVRDYCTEAGIEFSTVKTALQEMVDNL